MNIFLSILIILSSICFRMLINSVLFLAIWISSSLAEESSSNDATSNKRAPMGFQGMRGKKSLIPTSLEHNKLSKRTLMDFQVSYFSIKNSYEEKARKEIVLFNSCFLNYLRETKYVNYRKIRIRMHPTLKMIIFLTNLRNVRQWDFRV